LKNERLEGQFGAVVSELDPESMTDSEVKSLLNLLYEQRVVVVKTNGLSKFGYIAFAKRLGTPIPLSGGNEFQEIAEISNRATDTKKKRLGAAHWHTDQSFRSTVSSITMLHSIHVPAQGGETRFCNMAAAYDALPTSRKKQIEGLVGIHRHGVSIVARPGDHVPLPPKGWDKTYTAYHPLVREHPVTRQKTLYAVTGTIQGIVGMAESVAAELLEELCQHTFHERFLTSYAHYKHDIVMWDNPTTMHSATEIEQGTNTSNTRLLWRISLKGAPLVYEHLYDENLLDQSLYRAQVSNA